MHSPRKNSALKKSDNFLGAVASVNGRIIQEVERGAIDRRPDNKSGDPSIKYAKLSSLLAFFQHLL